jgi:hypothetical protein
MSYEEEAKKDVESCANILERRGKGLMIIRDVAANKTGEWLQGVAARLRAMGEEDVFVTQADQNVRNVPRQQKARPR